MSIPAISRYNIFRPEDIEENPCGDWVKFTDLPEDLQREIEKQYEKDLDADTEKT